MLLFFSLLLLLFYGGLLCHAVGYKLSSFAITTHGKRERMRGREVEGKSERGVSEGEWGERAYTWPVSSYNNVHTLCARAANALVRLYRSTGLPGPLLLVDARP